VERFREIDHMRGLVIPGRHRRWRERNPWPPAGGYGFRARRIRSRVYPRSALYDAHIGNSRCAAAPRNDAACDSNHGNALLVLPDRSALADPEDWMQGARSLDVAYLEKRCHCCGRGRVQQAFSSPAGLPFWNDVAPSHREGAFNDRFVRARQHNIGGSGPTQAAGRRHEDLWRRIHKHGLLCRCKLNRGYRVSGTCQACEWPSQHLKLRTPPAIDLYGLPLR